MWTATGWEALPDLLPPEAFEQGRIMSDMALWRAPSIEARQEYKPARHFSLDRTRNYI